MLLCACIRKNAPFCKVKVDVCGFTFATRPSTTVFGGFCSVTVTEIPMRAVAMVADGKLERGAKHARGTREGYGGSGGES